MSIFELKIKLDELIEKAQEKGLSLSRYLASNVGKLEMGTSFVVLVAAYAYVEALWLYSRLQYPLPSLKIAYYIALAAGSKAIVQLNNAKDSINQTYTLLSKFPTFLKGFNMSMQDIRDVMQQLEVPQEEIDNLPDQSMILPDFNQRIQNAGGDLDALNPGGDETEDYKLNNSDFYVVFFPDEATRELKNKLCDMIENAERAGQDLNTYLGTPAGKLDVGGSLVLLTACYSFTQSLMLNGSLSQPNASANIAIYTGVAVGTRAIQMCKEDNNLIADTYALIEGFPKFLKGINILTGDIKRVMQQLEVSQDEIDNLPDQSMVLLDFNRMLHNCGEELDGLNPGGDGNEGGAFKVNSPELVYDIFIPVNVVRFANSFSLMMYHTDNNITKIIKNEPITPPDLFAKLLLHCYNKSIEYLVWMWPASDDLCKCLIQRNGVAIDEFISVYPAIPEYSDAYIDAAGSLIWVAEANAYIDGESVYVMAKYSNDILINSKSYTYASLVSSMESNIADRLFTAYENTSITTTNHQETTEISTWSVSPNIAFGTIYESQYNGKQAGSSLYNSANFYNYIVDLWNLDIYASLTGYGNYLVGKHMAAIEYDRFTGEPIDSSYLAGVDLNIRLELRRRYKSSDDSVVAEWQNINPDSLSKTVNARYSTDITVAPNGSGAISGYVGDSDGKGKITRTGFISTISYSTDGIDLAQCVLKFTSGPNAGKFRTITSPPSSFGGGNTHYLSFDSEWDYTPLVGDTFTIDVAIATRTTVETMADFNYLISDFESTLVNESPDILTNLGDRYTVRQELAAIESGYAPEFKWELDYNSEKIFDGGNAYVCIQPKAWCIKNNTLIGVLPESGTVIKAQELSEVTTEAGLFYGNIVTKRFNA